MMKSIFSSLANAFRTHIDHVDTKIVKPSRQQNPVQLARDIQTKRADIWGQFLTRGQSRQKALVEKYQSRRGVSSREVNVNLPATAPNSPRVRPVKIYSQKTKNALMKKKNEAIDACREEIILIQRLQRLSRDPGKVDQTKTISQREAYLLKEIQTLERHVRKLKSLPSSTL